jgi:hypothetical protein
MQFSDYYPSWKNLVVGKEREMLRYLGARSAKRVFSVFVLFMAKKGRKA